MADVRIPADLDLHPDLRRAAPYALDVFVALLRVAKGFGWGGRIAHNFAEPEYLAERMRWGSDRVDAIQAAVLSLEAIGWIRRDPKRLTLRDWPRYQGDATGADRQAALRARRAGGASFPGGAESNAMSRYVAEVTRPAMVVATPRAVQEPISEQSSDLLPPLRPPLPFPDVAKSGETSPPGNGTRDSWTSTEHLNGRSLRPESLLPFIDRALAVFGEATGVPHRTGDDRGPEAVAALGRLLPRLLEREDGHADRVLLRLRRVGVYLKSRWADSSEMVGHLHVVTAARHFDRYEEQALASGVLPEKAPAPSTADPAATALLEARRTCGECVSETGEPCPAHGGTLGCRDCRASSAKVCDVHRTERLTLFRESVVRLAIAGGGTP